MDPKPIPAFYCCYLLRSTVRHASLYVGSTPHPARRLSQHNGSTKGGASRTARNSLRPWEMACIVAGFPSNIAALQFEWAWQNAHLTRRIADSDRITLATTTTKLNRTTGQLRRRKVRPGMSLADRLGNLHLLLQAPSFARWPLELRFFAEDVYTAWKKRCADLGNDLEGSVNVVLDLPCSTAGATGDSETHGGLKAVDPTYRPIKNHVEKSLFLLAEGENAQCTLCKEDVKPRQATLVCSNPDCSAASHMACLSRHFLGAESAIHTIPKQGTCPRCHSELKWVDLIREMSLRTRAQKDIEKLLKKRKVRAKASKSAKSATASLEDDILLAPSEEGEDDDEGNIRAEDVADEPLRHEAVQDDDAMSVVSIGSAASEPGIVSQRALQSQGRLDDVVEDSEWEDAEVVT